MKAPQVLPHTTESLVALLVEMMEAGPVAGRTHADWVASKAPDIAMVILADFAGECRRCRGEEDCGIVPLRLIDDVTQPMPIPVVR